MLTKVKLKNFKSFKEETIFDFTATKYSMLKDENTVDGVLKGCMFAGGNATGKTNALYAISILLDLLFKNANIDMPMNFCFFSKELEMDLEYTFVFDTHKIIYVLAVDRGGIIKKEEVILDGKTLLDRIGLNARTELTENKSYDKTYIEERTPFIKAIYFNTKFTNCPPLKVWFDYMSSSVYFNAERQQLLVGQALSYNINNKVVLRDYLDSYGVDALNQFFDFFGFQQRVKYEQSQRLSEFVSAEVPMGMKAIYLKRNDIDFWLPIELESLGNRTLLNMLPALLQVVDKGGMFLVDEFSSAFHNELEELIVRYFMRNANHAQMFFVSHSTNLMKTSLLRPDQIYAVEFDGTHGSKIRRFSDEQPRESQNLEKMYLGGVFGGLPGYKKDID